MRREFEFAMSLLLAACGGQSSSHGRDEHDFGGTAGTGGTSVAGVGGSGVGTGGTSVSGSSGSAGSTGADASGGVANEPCPADEPSLGSVCSTNFNCTYPACGDPTASMWGCREQHWAHIRVPSCSPEGCPDDFPEALSLCDVPYANVCSYERACCDAMIVSTARCLDGVWEVDDELDPETARPVCPYCPMSYNDDGTCTLPDGCSELTCHARSCYQEPYVTHCIGGRFSAVNLCRK